MTIKFNISENEFNQLANVIDTTEQIISDSYGCIIVDNKLLFDIGARKDFDGYYRMNLDVYDLDFYEVCNELKRYKDISDRFPLSDIENEINLYCGYEAFKKSVEKSFKEFIEF